jgi:glucuronate isomerase
MLHDRLAQELYSEICHIPLIDSHTHINPHEPAARSLEEILGYHYYTELAHSVGMDQQVLSAEADPRERVRAILYHMSRFDNTVQYSWFVEIVRAFFNFQGERLTLADSTWLFDTAERKMAQPDWEDRVLRLSNIEKVFLTNDFDDPLEGFDTNRYIPCLRTDDLVFRLHDPEIRRRLAATTGVAVSEPASLRRALGALFKRFTASGARACAISLPPDFSPEPIDDSEFSRALADTVKQRDTSPDSNEPPSSGAMVAKGVFWAIAQSCRDFQLPFDLMIGVKRRVYEHGVHQGQDLFDQRTSLIQFARLFNDFPDVTFCVSVLSSGQNQELASYSWIFPNVVTSGHWWYSNIPAYIEQDVRVRLQAVPKTKQIGYYSDMYKLEFGLPKFNMYRRILAQILANEFLRPRLYSEAQALELARLLLRDNPRRIFNV